MPNQPKPPMVTPKDEFEATKRQILAKLDEELVTPDMDENDKERVNELKEGLTGLIDAVQSTTEPLMQLVNARLTLVERDIQTTKAELIAFEKHLKDQRMELAADFVIILRCLSGELKVNPEWIQKLTAVSQGK